MNVGVAQIKMIFKDVLFLDLMGLFLAQIKINSIHNYCQNNEELKKS